MVQMLLNVMCSECNRAFDSCSNVYGTSCGHLLHFSCLSEFQRKGSNCNKCHRNNLYPYKLYFSFEGPDDDEAEKRAAAELKLTKSNNKITRLRVELSESQTNFLELQKQFSAIEESKLELKKRIEEVDESERNFMQLQRQYTESAEQVKELENRIRQLTIEKEGKSKELLLKRLENEMLNANADREPTTKSGSILSEKVKVMERKLKLMSEEFEKEITTSTQLSIDNMKLNTLISHLTSLEQNTQPAAATANDVRTAHHNRNQSRRQHVVPSRGQAVAPNPGQAAEPNPNDPLNGVLVKGLPLQLITMPLENTIVNLALKMQLYISSHDLLKVNFIENKTSSKPALLAQFKSNRLKDKFLSKKNILRSDPATKSISMSEFMSEELLPLYQYAKEKLPIDGFKCIYSKDNRIYAKKERHDRNGVQILSKMHVDSMIERHMNANAIDNLNGGDVDENFYQL